jgi:hypothetical protein
MGGLGYEGGSSLAGTNGPVRALAVVEKRIEAWHAGAQCRPEPTPSYP